MAPRVDPVASDEAFPARADVVIIGGGIIGTSAALFLAQQGVSTVLCEKGHIAGEQSSRNWGWCRKMVRDPRELPLIIESLRIWQGMNQYMTERFANTILGVNTFHLRRRPDVNVGDLGLVTNVTIANNTMVAVNGAVEYAIWIFKNLSTAVVKNNTVYDHGNAFEPYIRVDAGASGLSIGSNSISKSNGTAPVGSPYPNDLWMVNPQFVSMAGRDFHLQSTSPLIDKGATLSTVTNDMDGVLRPLGIGYDIGAYEKQ